MPTRSTDRPLRLGTPAELSRWSLRCHAAGMTVGLVPTMGALHAGHRSLIDAAVAECDRVVVSIFVNPAQFAAGEDLDSYPRMLDADLAVLAEAGVHAAFIPGTDAMYPPGGVMRVHVLGPLGERYEAASRPGHVDGVALVVTKLLVAARPDRAYFGLKDAQQCAMVERLARELDTGVKVVPCPTVRDPDGLALSSRNVRLSPAQRVQALAIPSGLSQAMARFDAGERDPVVLRATVQRCLDVAGVAADYVAVVKAADFEEAEIAGPDCKILVAARIGGTRLIDNVQLGVDAAPVVDGASEGVCSGRS